MLKKITGNLQKIKDWQNKKYLLAVSGGIDSMVLAHIFNNLNLDFSLAHCNFKLRGNESDADQQFVENFSTTNKIPLFVKTCDLSSTTENIQVAARNLRYEWFRELLELHAFDYLVTAHHLNDSIETFFINLLRGSGIKGLTGIINSTDIIRPMQDIKREEILKFANKNHLQWREDSSNESDKYQRNYIRHHIIPEFKKLNPDFENAMLKTFNLLLLYQKLTEDWFEIASNYNLNNYNEIQSIDLKYFKKQKHQELFLYHWLSPYGFSDWKAIKQLIDKAQNGKYLISGNYRLSKNKNQIILEEIYTKDNHQYKIHLNQTNIKQPLDLSVKLLKIEDVKNRYKKAAPSEVFLDYNRLGFPLIIRKWKAGDYFYPLGMKGKKKLSDFFIDEKMSLTEKEKIWLICTAENNIAWIVGKRPDNRYKITENTRYVVHIKINYNKNK